MLHGRSPSYRSRCGRLSRNLLMLAVRLKVIQMVINSKSLKAHPCSPTTTNIRPLAFPSAVEIED